MGPDLAAVVARVQEVRAATAPQRAVLVALSGIDASGKGFVGERLAGRLRDAGLRVALLHGDDWLRAPAELRPTPGDETPREPALPGSPEHFYRHAVRFDELFTRLVVPLRDRRGCRVEAQVAGATFPGYRPHLYLFADVDVVLLEGIFLLRRELRAHYDLSVWIACSFEVALRRAVARAQEGLSPEETVAAYESLYFPAQRLHLQHDGPEAAATLLLDNGS